MPTPSITDPLGRVYIDDAIFMRHDLYKGHLCHDMHLIRPRTARSADSHVRSLPVGSV